jgi:thiamine pyrophosphate-dependent acetolactate synthase large subunit-like protein
VISLQADGSAMYSLQALWTQARERCRCTTILLNNRSYNILVGEYKAVGATPGETAMRMLDLGNPALDWVKLAGGMGVEAARASTMESARPDGAQLPAGRPVPDRADGLATGENTLPRGGRLGQHPRLFDYFP